MVAEHQKTDRALPWVLPLVILAFVVVGGALIYLGLNQRSDESKLGGVKVAGPCRDLGVRAAECIRQGDKIRIGQCLAHPFLRRLLCPNLHLTPPGQHRGGVRPDNSGNPGSGQPPPPGSGSGAGTGNQGIGVTAGPVQVQAPPVCADTPVASAHIGTCP